MLKVKKIIAGGQSGVDLAALQVAIDLGIKHGGWCPPGRTNDEGTIPDRFLLVETPDEKSKKAPDIPRSLRTEWNVRDSDGSLVLFSHEFPSDPGTQWTMTTAKELQKHLLICDLATSQIEQVIADWLVEKEIEVLNVAGPLERLVPGIGKMTYDMFTKLFDTKSNQR